MVFLNSLDWLMLLKAFVIGGAICVIGQILIDKTKLTSARILVIFVTSGAILRWFRIISKISRFCRLSVQQFHLQDLETCLLKVQ